MSELKDEIRNIGHRISDIDHSTVATLTVIMEKGEEESVESVFLNSDMVEYENTGNPNKVDMLKATIDLRKSGIYTVIASINKIRHLLHLQPMNEEEQFLVYSVVSRIMDDLTISKIQPDLD